MSSGDSRPNRRAGARGGETRGRAPRTRGIRGPVSDGARRPSGGDRDLVSRGQRPRAESAPTIPDEITGRELDRQLAAQLKGLPERTSVRVARHLVASGVFMASNPELAYQHALAARGAAGRLAVVREAAGEAAYVAGHFAEALADLKAARRMNGSADFIAVMSDCERALGRPERALELVRSVGRDALPTELVAELTIVEAGARLDRGESDAALRTLEQAPLMSASREPWVARLRYAYADALLQSGREVEALEWFHRTEAIDGAGLTDAAERVRELESRLS